MADNTTITPGSGATVAADNIAGVLWQRIKVGFGADGSATDASASNGLPVEVVAGAFALANGDDPLTVGNDSDLIAPGIVISTSPAYSIGDVVGGRIQLANALGTLRSGKLASLHASFASANAPALDVLIFDAQPTQNTADNAAFAWNAADDGHLIWQIPIETTTWFAVPGALPRRSASVPIGGAILKSSGSQDLWVYVVTRTGFTGAATNEFRLKFGIVRD